MEHWYPKVGDSASWNFGASMFRRNTLLNTIKLVNVKHQNDCTGRPRSSDIRLMRPVLWPIWATVQVVKSVSSDRISVVWPSISDVQSGDPGSNPGCDAFWNVKLYGGLIRAPDLRVIQTYRISVARPSIPGSQPGDPGSNPRCDIFWMY